MNAPEDASEGSGDLDSKLERLALRARQGLPARASALRVAAEAITRGGGEARAELRRMAHKLHGTAGSFGMPELGEHAARVEASATAHTPSTDLAASARALADACDAESRPGGVPAERPTAPTERVPEPTTTRVRALVVDDDPAIGKLVGLLLERMGDYEVEVKSSPADALAWLDAGAKPALLVVDAMMPDMNGRALAQAVRGRPGYASLPVAILSAATATELGWDDGDFVPDAWITKPVRAAELLAELNKLH